MYFYLKNLTSISCYVYFVRGPYDTICLNFTLAITCAYEFYFDVMYMCFYLKMLTSMSCYIYFVRDHVT